MSNRVFRDRHHAGRELAALLTDLQYRSDVVVLGLARGGVPVAFEVARSLGAPLEVFVVRKLGVPGHEELAMGAIAGGGVTVLNDQVIASLGIEREEIDRITEAETVEILRRERLYRDGRRPPQLSGKTVLIVDDGVATGSDMRAAIEAVRRLEPERIVVGLPTAPVAVSRDLGEMVDELVCVTTPEPFSAVGQSYADFGQTSDDEVRELLLAASSQD